MDEAPGYVALGLLDDHVRHCIQESKAGERSAKADELMGAVEQLLKG